MIVLKEIYYKYSVMAVNAQSGNFHSHKSSKRNKASIGVITSIGHAADQIRSE